MIAYYATAAFLLVSYTCFVCAGELRELRKNNGDAYNCCVRSVGITNDLLQDKLHGVQVWIQASGGISGLQAKVVVVVNDVE